MLFLFFIIYFYYSFSPLCNIIDRLQQNIPHLIIMCISTLRIFSPRQTLLTASYMAFGGKKNLASQHWVTKTNSYEAADK